jgi:hypothetical protein
MWLAVFDLRIGLSVGVLPWIGVGDVCVSSCDCLSDATLVCVFYLR